MVYIKENTENLILPKHNLNIGNDDRGFMVFLSAPSYPRKALTAGKNLSTNEFYWEFNIKYSTKPENIGEYTYEVEDITTHNVVEIGLLVYGDYVREEVKSINNKQKNVQLKYGK